jgi:hypothetical protein
VLKGKVQPHFYAFGKVLKKRNSFSELLSRLDEANLFSAPLKSVHPVLGDTHESQVRVLSFEKASLHVPLQKSRGLCNLCWIFYSFKKSEDNLVLLLIVLCWKLVSKQAAPQGSLQVLGIFEKSIGERWLESSRQLLLRRAHWCWLRYLLLNLIWASHITARLFYALVKRRNWIQQVHELENQQEHWLN